MCAEICSNFDSVYRVIAASRANASSRILAWYLCRPGCPSGFLLIIGTNPIRLLKFALKHDNGLVHPLIRVSCIKFA
ncbi:gallidermin family lantibiotic [Pantoea latae]|uniref:gallidermin family lantibiotic n=1 Tax=Pantoea latae TaxID=1964541 RepID=UPI00117CECAB